MRFIRNEIQQPKYLVAPEKRSSPMYYLLVFGVSVAAVGVAGFFSAFFYADLINSRWGFYYRDVQTYSIFIVTAGVILYIIAALYFKIALRKTTFYKIRSILKNEPYDPPRKGDFTKTIYAKLHELNDQWGFYSEINPPESDSVIPQVLIGPGGVYTFHPVSENPSNKEFKDPGTTLSKASKALQKAINEQVIPIIIFSTPKMVSLYKSNHDAKTRVMSIREILDYFQNRNNKLDESTRTEIEEKVFQMIKGTPTPN